MGGANEPRSDCPINVAVEVFGDRWSLLVLRDIAFGDRRYFREFMDELRHPHLGSDTPPRSPDVRERLNAACLTATDSS